MAISSIFSCEANRWNIAKFVLAMVFLASFVRVVIATAVLMGKVDVSDVLPRIAANPQGSLILNGCWALIAAGLFAWAEQRRRRAQLSQAFES
jgi:hypothetical protein